MRRDRGRRSTHHPPYRLRRAGRCGEVGDLLGLNHTRAHGIHVGPRPSSLHRQSHALSRFETLGPLLDRALLRYARRATASWVRPVVQLRAQLGLSPRVSPIFEGQFSPTLIWRCSHRSSGLRNRTGHPYRYHRLPFLPRGDCARARAARLLCRRTTAGGVHSWFLGIGHAGNVLRAEPAGDSPFGLSRRFIVGEFAPDALSHPLPPDVAVFPYAPYSELFTRAPSTFIRAELVLPPRRCAPDAPCWSSHSRLISPTMPRVR